MLKYIRVYEKIFSSLVFILFWWCQSAGLILWKRPQLPKASGHMNPVIPTSVLSSQPCVGDGSSGRRLTAPELEFRTGAQWPDSKACHAMAFLGSRITGPTPLPGQPGSSCGWRGVVQAGCSPLKQSGKRKFPRRLEGGLWSYCGPTSSMPEIVSSGGHFFLLGAKMQVIENETLGITRSFTHSSRISQRPLRWRVGWLETEHPSDQDANLPQRTVYPSDSCCKLATFMGHSCSFVRSHCSIFADIYLCSQLINQDEKYQRGLFFHSLEEVLCSFLN